MTPSEIIDSSFRLYQRLGLTFLRLSVVPTLLCVAALAFVNAYVVPELIYGQSNDFTVYIEQLVAGILLAVFIGGPLFLSGVAYTTAIAVSLVSDDLVGNVPSPQSAEQVARASMPRLLVTMIKELVLSLGGFTVAVLILIGGMALGRVTPDSDVWAGVVSFIGVIGLLAGLWIAVAIVIRDSAVAPAVVLENLGAKAAGKRSRQLLGKDRVHGAGTRAAWNAYMLLGLIVLLFQSSIEIFLSLIGVADWAGRATMGSLIRPLLLQAIELLPTFLTIWIVLPVWATIVTVIYFDRRVRLEGFDVDVLARNLARNATGSRYQL